MSSQCSEEKPSSYSRNPSKEQTEVFLRYSTGLYNNVHKVSACKTYVQK